MSGVFGVLLAAGAASRFGGGKLLAPFRGRPLVEHALLALHASPVDGAVAVVGEGSSGELRRLCGRYGVRVVENPRWREGQSTSVRAGIRALGPEARAAVVLLGDQPLVGAGAVARLVRAFEKGARIAVATYGGSARNPVLFAREVWPLLEDELEGDEGARRVLRRHPELVCQVPCDGVGDPADVDTKEDLRRLEERAAG
ncbi:4-diphosphocytidyl-2C-methyl-D-erythritol synthase [Rubrobacter xylanophilus]|uniref:4-diphosphocytidyl-2C-methyl-D-erythritol synthase n=1 Tax=Rubrobacter xylanophilus TaxID=49319 RepID=A0A510HKE0_9ACTN|nr:nucleotidyltransferase family protein [Rubrobacter xylanophilus]BBL80364.1 4-diphosphocytidyl-2C-methyl-D-erythritol synthase [Rubrobacter xylanophilus]